VRLLLYFTLQNIKKLKKTPSGCFLKKNVVVQNFVPTQVIIILILLKK